MAMTAVVDLRTAVKVYVIIDVLDLALVSEGESVSMASVLKKNVQKILIVPLIGSVEVSCVCIPNHVDRMMSVEMLVRRTKAWPRLGNGRLVACAAVEVV